MKTAAHCSYLFARCEQGDHDHCRGHFQHNDLSYDTTYQCACSCHNSDPNYARTA